MYKVYECGILKVKSRKYNISSTYLFHKYLAAAPGRSFSQKCSFVRQTHLCSPICHHTERLRDSSCSHHTGSSPRNSWVLHWECYDQYDTMIRQNRPDNHRLHCRNEKATNNVRVHTVFLNFCPTRNSNAHFFLYEILLFIIAIKNKKKITKLVCDGT